MDYKEKYEQALERASKLRVQNPFDTVGQMVEHIFPDLQESEDERIRKSIISILKGEIRYISIEDTNKYVTWLEKQGEQPTDKVEPKFNVGDWVVKQDGESFWNGNCVAQIINITDYGTDYGKYWLDIDCWIEPGRIRLWSINDAKDGDVLAYVTDEEDLWIMIYRSLYEPYEGHVHYHALLVNDNFSDKGTCCICIDNLKPATKEQRDLLFQKMKDAGYEWNSEKKQLSILNLGC